MRNGGERPNRPAQDGNLTNTNSRMSSQRGGSQQQVVPESQSDISPGIKDSSVHNIEQDAYAYPNNQPNPFNKSHADTTKTQSNRNLSNQNISNNPSSRKVADDGTFQAPQPPAGSQRKIDGSSRGPAFGNQSSDNYGYQKEGSSRGTNQNLSQRDALYNQNHASNRQTNTGNGDPLSRDAAAYDQLAPPSNRNNYADDQPAETNNSIPKSFRNPNSYRNVPENEGITIEPPL